MIGPALPFASIHPSPDTPDGRFAGYHPERPIRGFSQLHVSGTGWGQYGNFLVSPQIGLAVGPLDHDSPKTGEKAEAFQYQVRLTRYDILARLAPTRRAAIYQFTFPASDQAHLVLDVVHSIPRDIATQMKGEILGGDVTISPDGRTITGMGYFSGGFGGPYRAYFYAEVDRAPTGAGVWKNDGVQPEVRSTAVVGKNERIGAYLRFNTKAGEVITMKIGVSFLSVEKAAASLRAEIPGWDYETLRAAGERCWNDALAGIEIHGGTDEERTIFTTALYHSMLMPRDRTGEFARFSAGQPMWDDQYAIWDTFRTLYPLLALIRPDVVRGTVQSFIERQRVDGDVPDTFVAGVNRFSEQGGNDIDMIVADAHAKGITGIDWGQAYAVMKHNADHRRNGVEFLDAESGLNDYRKNGWIPAGIMSSSYTLEYAANDFAVSQVAAALGQKADAVAYEQRSRLWEKLWNAEATSDGFKGFVMPRNANCTWVEWDSKTVAGSWKPYFYEGNSWTYSYLVPHQARRLVELMGGPVVFAQRLDHALTADLINLYNEPAFLAPQLFHYASRPDLTAKWLANITRGKYTLRGYPGDDDSGAMSSYYVWAKIGLFPNAGQDYYFLNGPAFERVRVNRPEQGLLEITRTGKGIYIAEVRLNGKPLERSWVRHRELNGPCHLAFLMSETPTEWGRHSPPPPSLGAQ